MTEKEEKELNKLIKKVIDITLKTPQSREMIDLNKDKGEDKATLDLLVYAFRNLGIGEERIKKVLSEN